VLCNCNQCINYWQCLDDLVTDLLKMTTLSAMSKASSWSCVTRILVTPTLWMMSLTESRRDLRTWATGNHHMVQVKPSHGTACAITWHSSSHHMACSTSRVLSMQRHPRDSPRDQGHQKAHQEEAAGGCKLGLLPGLLSASALLTAVAACAHHSLAAPPSSAMLPLCKQNSLLDVLSSHLPNFAKVWQRS